MKHLVKLIIVYIIVLFVLAENVALQQKVSELQSTVSILTADNASLAEENAKLQQTKSIEAQKTNRGGERGECRIMEITAYDLSVESCGKAPDHPLYGITASGKRVEEWNTIAMGKSYPFGTKVFIPAFASYPNKGWFVCEDRGSAIGDTCIDIYFGENSEAACIEFGRQELEVYIYENDYKEN